MDAGAKFNFMNQIQVNEVGPRDGLQNIDTILNVGERLQLIQSLQFPQSTHLTQTLLLKQLELFLQNPIYIFEIWNGGMSFHGGLIGIVFSMFVIISSCVS